MEAGVELPGERLLVFVTRVVHLLHTYDLTSGRILQEYDSPRCCDPGTEYARYFSQMAFADGHLLVLFIRDFASSGFTTNLVVSPESPDGKVGTASFAVLCIRAQSLSVRSSLLASPQNLTRRPAVLVSRQFVAFRENELDPNAHSFAIVPNSSLLVLSHWGYEGGKGLTLYDWQAGQELVTNVGKTLNHVPAFGLLSRNRIVLAGPTASLASDAHNYAGRPSLRIISLDSPEEVVVCPVSFDPAILVEAHSLCVCKDAETYVVCFRHFPVRSTNPGYFTLEVWRDNECQGVFRVDFKWSPHGTCLASADGRIVFGDSYLNLFVFQ